MAYVTGSASSITDLLTALQSACTANGWTLTAGVLSRGDCHLKAAVSGSMLTLQAGLTDDGAGNLGTPSAVTYLQAPFTGEPIDYPCVYFAHVIGNEVYFVVRFHVDAYITLGFGQSPVPGLPGTGVWLCGNTTKQSSNIVFSTNSGDLYLSFDCAGMGLFSVRATYNPGQLPGQVHHGLDGGSWSQSSFGYGVGPNTGIDPGANASVGAIRLITNCQPNAWNGEAMLAPIQPVTSRGSGMISMVADLANARYVRLDNMPAETIIQLGSDKWRVYPWYRRNPSNRNVANGDTSSGTFGLALRYDGP